MDPFLGTGTTAIAARRLQRNFIGLEYDEFYVNIAREKIAKEKVVTYEGYPVSIFLGKVATMRDVDAQKLFPPQLTSTQKRKNKQADVVFATDHGLSEPVRLLEKKEKYAPAQDAQD